MRIRIQLYTKKLPILYRHRIMSLIKEALSISDPDYKEMLYPDNKKTKITKPFCFSVRIPSDKKITKEKMVIDKDISIEETVFYFDSGRPLYLDICSSDYMFIINLYNGLRELKEFRFSEDIILRIGRIQMRREKAISDDDVVFKTASPILLETRDGKPILPSETDIQTFNEHFQAIHNRILKDIRGNELYREMEFTTVKIKKQVVKHTLKGFREKTGRPYMTLTCFEGCFKLKGDPRDLQMLYQIGIGLRTGQGFGMVEVI